MTIPRRDERRTFVDTSAFFAIVDRGDSQHLLAFAVQQRLTKERWRLYTSNFVLAETHALVLNRLGRQVATHVLQQLDRSAEQGGLTLVRVTAGDELRARQIVYGYNDKDFSYVDASSFAIMERLGIPTAFSFDGHFRQFGFALLEG